MSNMEARLEMIAKAIYDIDRDIARQVLEEEWRDWDKIDELIKRVYISVARKALTG